MAYVRCSGDIAFCLNIDRDVVILTFDFFNLKINGFPGLIVKHLYVERLCVKLEIIFWKNK